MELEEAKKILLNCYPMKTTHVLDDTNKANKEAIEVVLKELTVKNNKIDKAIKYIKEKQKIQYKYTLSKIEIDELLKILEG